MRNQIPRASLKVYTRTGDKGTTGLIGPNRFSKSELVFEVLGTNDELSSHIGLANAYLKHEDGLKTTSTQLNEIQQNLQSINAKIAGSVKPGLVMPKAAVLEAWIDEYDTLLPPLSKFILPVPYDIT